MADDAQMFKMVVVDLDDLQPLLPRKLDDARVDELARDIAKHGLKEPLLVGNYLGRRGTWYVIDGPHRLEALRRLGTKAAHAVWSPAPSPLDPYLRILWRRGPSEIERLWAMIHVTADALQVDVRQAHEFLLEAVRARQRAKGILPQEELGDLLEHARAVTEDTLPEEATADSASGLDRALEFLASEDLQGLHERFTASGLPHWLDYLHGRLRLLALPTPFLEHAARRGIGASQLFALKKALDGGASLEQVEAMLARAHQLDAKQLAAELGQDAQPGNEPEVRQVLQQLRRLPRLLKRRIAEEPDPEVLDRLNALLAEVERILQA